MGTRTVGQLPLIDIHARITKGLYDQIVRECGHCSCTMTNFIRTAIAKEVSARQRARNAEASTSILEGQMMLEGTDNGK